jgi:H+/Cl- antiporter ClcA
MIALARGNLSLYLGATIAGLLAGLIGAAFHALLDLAEGWRDAAPFLIERLPWVNALPGWAVLMGLFALVLPIAGWLVRRFAPESAGSGIQEIEAILEGEGTLRWRRILPVKFVAGALAVGSGLVLGREGPTVHMGGALGQMAAEWLRVDPKRARTLVAAGAAAGLSVAFNAPLAAIVFVTEELREGFEYGFAQLQSVTLASCLAVVVGGWMLGQGPVLPVPRVEEAPLWALPLFVLLGVGIGALGVLFNDLLLRSVRLFKRLRGHLGLLPTALGGVALAVLLWFSPGAVGGGEALVERLIREPPVFATLSTLLLMRLLTTVGSYGLGLPGGIFAPMLGLGTLAGATFDALVQGSLPTLSPGLFAVASMGALFAATVRAPLTGTVLAVELTGALDLALPTILTCLAATFAAEALGGKPVYGLLLAESRRSSELSESERRRFRPLAPALGSTLVALGALAVLTVAGLISGQFSEPPVGPSAPRAPRSPDSQLSRPASPIGSMPAVSQKVAPTPPSAPIDSSRRPAAAGETEVASPVAVSESAAKPGRSPDGSTPQPGRAPVKATGSKAPPPTAVGPSFAIQLASFRRPETLVRYARRNGLSFKRSTLERSNGWYALLYGNFPSRAEAQAALDRLPGRLRKSGALVRELPASAKPLPVR